jgi:hypothetical protein
VDGRGKPEEAGKRRNDEINRGLIVDSGHDLLSQRRWTRGLAKMKTKCWTQVQNTDTAAITG